MKKTPKRPKKWSEIYQHGTSEGDTEQIFFIYLAREAKYDFSSIADISLHCKISKEKAEQIISKYARLNILIQNPKNEDQWGYWERCMDYLPEEEISLSKKDHQKRISLSRKHTQN